MAKDKKRMQQNRARKKARLEARKKARKKQRARGLDTAFARLGSSRSQISRAPLGSAWRRADIFEQGIGEVLITRSLPDGRLATGIFLVDIYCLGVKNAFITIRTLSEIRERFMDAQPMVEVSPSYARKLIEQSVEYARHLGFEPHEDYDDAQVVFGDIDPAACEDTFVFGKDGKPFFINGPYISPQRSEIIIKKLKDKLGPDGFHYLVGMDKPPGNSDERDWQSYDDDGEEDWEEGGEEDWEEDGEPEPGDDRQGA